MCRCEFKPSGCPHCRVGRSRMGWIVKGKLVYSYSDWTDAMFGPERNAVTSHRDAVTPGIVTPDPESR